VGVFFLNTVYKASCARPG